MRVAIVTSRRRGMASLSIPLLVSETSTELVSVIFNDEPRAGGGAKRKLRKAFDIGLLGAVNGVRIRPWFSDEVDERLAIPDIGTTCEAHGVPLVQTPRLNGQETIDALTTSGADLGLSLGNPYIAARVYETPPEGMLNVHHELLPEYAGAQAVIWQIYDGHSTTGYSIHRIDAGIDTGDILLKEELPIRFGSNLHETVVLTLCEVLPASAHGLVRVLADFGSYASEARANGVKRRLTTPTYRQFRRMEEMHDRLAAGSETDS
jgi:methionyl-tRNA formyltransferase